MRKDAKCLSAHTIEIRELHDVVIIEVCRSSIGGLEYSARNFRWASRYRERRWRAREREFDVVSMPARMKVLLEPVRTGTSQYEGRRRIVRTKSGLGFLGRSSAPP